jgi:hypothetical protein
VWQNCASTISKARSRPTAGRRRQNLPFRLLSLHREVDVLLKIGRNEENLDISEKPKKKREKWQKKKKDLPLVSRKKRNKTGKRKWSKSGHEKQQPNKTSDGVRTQNNREKFDSCRIGKQPAVK